MKTTVIALANQKGAEPKRAQWVMQRGGSPVSNKQCERQRSSAPIANCGGVGKTTTAVNLGIGLARQGRKVLLIDADSQGNLTDALGWKNPDTLEQTLPTVLRKVINDEIIEPKEAILHHEEGVDLMPSNIELSALEMTLFQTMRREYALADWLKTVKQDYDYVLIDCSPSLGMITINALVAADSVIIPVQSHYLPTKGMSQLMQTINRVRRGLNPSLRVDGALLTMTDSRTLLSREVSSALRNSYAGKLRIFQTEIPFAIRTAEAAAAGKSVFAHDPDGKTAAAYTALTKEVEAYGRQRARADRDQLDR